MFFVCFITTLSSLHFSLAETPVVVVVVVDFACLVWFYCLGNKLVPFLTRRCGPCPAWGLLVLLRFETTCIGTPAQHLHNTCTTLAPVRKTTLSINLLSAHSKQLRNMDIQHGYLVQHVWSALVLYTLIPIPTLSTKSIPEAVVNSTCHQPPTPH